MANITTVAATAEVLATIVNTVGAEKLARQLDATTLRNVRAAAQQEKNHYELLTSSAVGGKVTTTSIHVPDEVFSSPTALLTTLAVGDQVVHRLLPAGRHRVRSPGDAEGLEVRPYTAEIMAVEAVHGALALQSLGKLGDDRTVSSEVRSARGRRRPRARRRRGTPGFYKIMDAVAILESAGFGFGKAGSKPGQVYRVRCDRGRRARPPIRT